ncbi:MAG TPA: nuclear transport factor 2 family protein [Myxococcota bacterium]|nr:nuclear transport factor 2 family protein [Myxococcota bacterium]HRY92743.1 nuclear transport factor 2 family protein [Myxococcota bacterium]HSA20715.1 nuclear transport factor 2 family protein [Myxococcota bacterium]
MDWTRTQILAVVEESPARVAAHDRAGWLGLFGADAVVEDPVGGAPVRRGPGARDPLGAFFDTFIALHDIRFEVLQDCVFGLEVMRDVVIHTRISGRELAVPAYLLYQLAEEGGRLVIRRMAAHWELSGQTRAALGQGPGTAWAVTRLFGRMLRVMGPGWVGRYLGAYGGAGARGKRLLVQLGRALDARDARGLAGLFASPADGLGHGPRRLSPDGLLSAIPAGARIAFDRPLSAGLTTAARYALEGGPSPSRGVLLLSLVRAGRALAIDEARLFPA